MRTRRQRLQVSTFPFLAVLLCAMGSLILLLLVMDRRAPAGALHKARHAPGEAQAGVAPGGSGPRRPGAAGRRSVPARANAGGPQGRPGAAAADVLAGAVPGPL